MHEDPNLYSRVLYWLSYVRPRSHGERSKFPPLLNQTNAYKFDTCHYLVLGVTRLGQGLGAQ